MNVKIIIFLFTYWPAIMLAQSFQVCPIVSGTGVADPACISANQATATASSTAAAQALIGSGTLTPPTLNCGTPPDPACLQNYDTQMKIYTKTVSDQVATEATVDPATFEAVKTVTSTSATGSLSEIISKSIFGVNFYTTAATSATVAAADNLLLASTCASNVSCLPADANEQYAQGASYLVAQKAATLVSDQLYQSGLQACLSRNAISSVQVDCLAVLGSTPSQILNQTTITALTTSSTLSLIITGPGSVSGTVFNALTGACNPPGSSACIALTNLIGAAPLTIQNALRGAIFKNGKVDFKSLFTVNADGSIKLNNGKVYSAADFKNPLALIAKGLSAQAAQRVSANYSALSSSLTLAAKTSVSGTPSVTEEIISSGEVTQVVSAKLNLTENEQGLLGDLSQDYYGEPIGVSKDDIFKIINRRYLKQSQEGSFLNSE